MLDSPSGDLLTRAARRFTRATHDDQPDTYSGRVSRPKRLGTRSILARFRKSSTASSTSTSSEDETLPNLEQEPLEQNRCVERSLMSSDLEEEIRLLRARISQLERHNYRLTESNERPIYEGSNLDLVQPASYDTYRCSATVPAPYFDHSTQYYTPIPEGMALDPSSIIAFPPSRLEISRNTQQSFLPSVQPSSAMPTYSIHSTRLSEYQGTFEPLSENLLQEWLATAPSSGDEVTTAQPYEIGRQITRPQPLSLKKHDTPIIETATTASSLHQSGFACRSLGHPKKSRPTKSAHYQFSTTNQANSLAEFRARQMNVDAVQQPITPYRQRSVTARQFQAVKGVAGSIVRRLTDEDKDLEDTGKETAPRRRGSFQRLLGALTPKKKEDEDGMDISQNF